jgi:hypothetical protein
VGESSEGSKAKKARAAAVNPRCRNGAERRGAGCRTGLAHEVLVAVPADGGSLLSTTGSEEAINSGACDSCLKGFKIITRV